MFPRAVQTYVLSYSARIAKNELETEDIVTTLLAARGMVKTKLLQAPMESLLRATFIPSECRYYANWRTKPGSRVLAMGRNFEKASV